MKHFLVLHLLDNLPWRGVAVTEGLVFAFCDEYNPSVTFGDSSLYTREPFLYHRKLRKINLAVLRCLDTRITAIGEQLRVGVAHFFMFIYVLSIFLTSTAFVDTNAKPYKKRGKKLRLFATVFKRSTSVP